MGREDEPNINPSRRRILALFGQTIVTGFNTQIRGREHQDMIHSTNANRQPVDQHATSSQIQRKERPAFVALPGLSMASLLANLPYLMTGWTELRPTILMDIHDYNRLQAIALKESDTPWNQSLAMAYGHLFRRGMVRLIDYAEFYRNYTQQKTIQKNRAILEEISTEKQKDAAESAAENRIAYQRGEYQESFRESLGKDLDISIGGRKTEKKRYRKLKRGVR